MDDSDDQPVTPPDPGGTAPDAMPSSPGADPSADVAAPAEGQADPTQWAGSERDVETQSLDRLQSLGGREALPQELQPLDVPRSLPEVRRPRFHGRLRGIGVARLAAPVVLLVAVITVFSIAAHSGLFGGSSNGTHHTSGSAAKKAGKPARKYFVVRAGQSLSQISAKTGVTIQTLMSLNPQITDPANLRVGMKLKLPPPSQ